ncbi:hypothetical protein ABZ797_38545 [Streptomyces antimycoticus]
MVSQAGSVLLVETVRKAGLDQISAALAPWRRPRAVHDPGKVVLDLALAVAMAGIAWPMWACCGPSRPCSGRWPPTRRSPG